MSSSSTKHTHLRSQLDELASLLEGCATPLRAVPCVSALADSPVPTPPLDWAALPRAVDADSAALGVSTRKLTAKQQAKQRPVDAAKVQARVARKRAQVESFLLVLRPLLAAAAAAAARQHGGAANELHVVDFGCGTGNLLLPLAALFPAARFTGVDMKPAALRLLQQRATAAGLSNVAAAGGMIEQFSQPFKFDVALALHACGNATDHVLQMAVDQGAAFVVSPCCVGKLRFSLTGGSSFHSQPVVWTPTLPGDRPVQRKAPDVDAAQTLQQPVEQQQQAAGVEAAAGAAPAVRKLRHPRSDWLLGQLQPEPERHFATLAKVADVAHAPAELPKLAEALQQRASVSDTCKRFVELDRCAAAAEAGYAVGLFKVLQAASMAKNDLLVGLPLHATAGAAAGAAEVATSTIDKQQQQQQRAGWLCECGRALAGSGRLLTAAAFQGAAPPMPE